MTEKIVAISTIIFLLEGLVFGILSLSNVPVADNLNTELGIVLEILLGTYIPGLMFMFYTEKLKLRDAEYTATLAPNQVDLIRGRSPEQMEFMRDVIVNLNKMLQWQDSQNEVAQLGEVAIPILDE